MIYLQLFIGFLKVGLFSFGGGYGSIALIREVVLSYGWLDDASLSYMIAVSESTPGPLMINTATYVGSVQAGLAGAAVATLAVSLPAFFIMLIVAAVLKKFMENVYVRDVLGGMQSAVIGMIVSTGLFMLIELVSGLWNEGGFDPRNLLVTVILLAFFYGGKYIFKKKISPILLIAVSAGLGILVF